VNRLPFFRGWAQLAKGQAFHYFPGETYATLCKYWVPDDRKIHPAKNQTGNPCEQDCPDCRRRM